MQIPIQITFRGLPKSEALDALIAKEVEHLEKTFDRITACRVTVSETQHRSQTRKNYSVHIALAVPGEELIANHDGSDKDHHADAYQAAALAFAACRRELQDYLRRLRGEVKSRAAAPGVTTTGK